MARRLPVTESDPVKGLTADEVELVRSRLKELSSQLKPRRPFLTNTADLGITNLVGAVQVTPDLVLDIRPKTRPDKNWAAALVDLLTPPTRIEFNGETKDAEQHAIHVLPDAFADLYARQLDRAVRREGPLTLIQPHGTSVPALAGRLDVTRWVRERVLRPAHFPQHQSRLTVDNPFTTAMAAVATLLATRTTNPRVAAGLRSAAARLRPGLPPHTIIDPGIGLRDLPPQWRAYEPAWTTARAVIRRIAPLHRDGTLDGLGLALEPWPLLETLLERALKATAELAIRDGHGAVLGMGHSGRYPLRTPIGSTPQDTHAFHVAGAVDPDGILTSSGRAVATFEAKYSRPTTEGIRTHSFQALTTAAALNAPIAVLVYPANFGPVSWDITGFHGHPRRLVAIGLDMYSYRHGTGDQRQGERLYQLVAPVLGTDAAAKGTPVSA